MHMVPPPPPPVTAKPVRMLDVETYRNFFLVKLYDIHTRQFFSIRLTATTPFNWIALATLLRDATIVTFNGNKYDMLMLSAVATGRFTNDMLKNLSDYIIKTKPPPQPWMVARDWGFDILELDHIDLIEIAPGDGSLKIYGGRLHCKKMQDLPYAPDRILTPDEMDATDLYCGNDLVTTADLYGALTDDIATRVQLGEQYGIDVRSKSDAQIAEAAFKKLLNLDGRAARAMVDQANAMYPPGARIFYKPAPFLRFQTPVMTEAFEMVQRLPFTITASGQPEMPIELKDFTIKLGPSEYRLGIGGLHSSEQNAAHRAGNGIVMVDVDVVSYYPKIISILRMFPHQIGAVFLTIYDGWIEVRIEYKNAGNKKKAATFKIKINGTFGKTGSKYSILFSPEMMLRTTLTGQFSLLMLIEMLYLSGIDVVSANTDGVVIKCNTAQVATRDAVVKQWEAMTGFETEANEYIALFSRDINNYMAFKPGKNGGQIEVKTKGAYADDPISRLAKNPANQICVDAVKAYIISGTPLEQTIRRCHDIRKFVTVRGVQGGGVWVKDTIIADTVGQKREILAANGWASYDKGKTWNTAKRSEQFLDPIPTDDAIKLTRAAFEREYLGKAVRWYYGRGQRGHIAYEKNGNLVARSEGAKPVMDLPDVLPPDIDYEFYIKEAESILVDLGVVGQPVRWVDRY